ncbi:MAG: hypothetical protein RJA99_3548 [Pseudomonadota bacterium]
MKLDLSVPRAALRAVVLAAALASAVHPAAVSAAPRPSDASTASAIGVALSVAAPLGLLVGGAVLTVASIQAVGQGTVIVLERASDGARASVTVAEASLREAALVTGAVIGVTALSTGLLLATGSRAIAFVPNELGRALLHDERVTR